MTQGRIDMCLASVLFYPTFTGAGLRFQRYAPGLRARGIDTRVFAGPTQENQKSGSLPENVLRSGTLLPIEQINGLPIQRVQLSQNSSFSRDVQYVRALLRYCHCQETRPDLIHLITASQYWLPYFFLFRRWGVPIVQSHTLLSALSSESWKRLLQRLFWRKLPFQLADCVVTGSVVGRDSLRNIGVSTRLEVIPNGVDLNRFQPVASHLAQKSLRRRLGLDPNGELLLFVGTLTERKGVDVLVDAWGLIAQKRPRAYLVLVGPTAEELRPEMRSTDFKTRIETAIASSGAVDRVITTGQVENVEDYLQAADVFVFPSRREGMPNVVLEAMACGLPCILTPFLGLPAEFGNPGEHYMLVERISEALAQATITLLENPQRMQQLGCQSLKWIEMHADIECSLDQYANLYRELVDRSRKRKQRAW